MAERLGGGGGRKRGRHRRSRSGQSFSGEQDFKCGLSGSRHVAQERPEQPDSEQKPFSL